MTKQIAHDPQILKGLLGMLILRLLADGESYGYEVATKFHELGLTAINEGTVYPALTRLEREGKLESRLVASNSGPARKYYRLSPQGDAELKRLLASWRELLSAVEPLLTKP